MNKPQDNTRAPHHKVLITEYVHELLNIIECPTERQKKLTQLINESLQKRKHTPRHYWLISQDPTIGTIIITHDETMHPHGIRISSLHEPQPH